MSLGDPEVVRAEYASERDLAAPGSIYGEGAPGFGRDVVFADHEAARAYAASSIVSKHLASRLLPFERPLVARARAGVLVAETAA